MEPPVEGPLAVNSCTLRLTLESHGMIDEVELMIMGGVMCSSRGFPSPLYTRGVSQELTLG